MRCPTLGEASLLVRVGKYTPTQLVEEALAQIELTEPKLKAWVTIDAEGAKSAAAQLTKEVEEGHIRSPLHGIPFGVKDIFDTKGLKTAMGSPIFQSNVPVVDAAVVARLRELGAIVLGKTHTTEFAGHDPAPTCNPWNLEHTPGGFQQWLRSRRRGGRDPLRSGIPDWRLRHAPRVVLRGRRH